MLSAFFPSHGGGIERVAGHLACELAKRHWTVTWMAGGLPNETPSSAECPSPVTVIRADSIDPIERSLGLPAPLWFPSSLWRLIQEIRRADIVHVHDYLYLANLLAIAAARLVGKPVVITQHIGEIPFKSYLPRLMLSALNRSIGALALYMCHQVVFIASPVKRYFQREDRRLRHAQLIPNGIDHEVFHPRLLSGQRTKSCRILFVGRYVEKKGIALLRQAVESLQDFCWDFVGTGPLSPALWELSEAARARIALHEHLCPSQLAELYRQADLLVLPSTGEGFPLVVQEALACGTPVLLSQEVAQAFEHSDIRCVHTVELRGLAPDAASAALTDSLRQLTHAASITDLRAPQTRTAAAELAAQWSWSGCASAYSECYESLLRS